MIRMNFIILLSCDAFIYTKKKPNLLIGTVIIQTIVLICYVL